MDIKNLHQQYAEHVDLDEMLKEHQQLVTKVSEVRSKLKFELMQSLASKTGRES